MLDGEILAIARIAAAVVRTGFVRLSPTKRISGRTHHRTGSHRFRYSSSAVTRICDAGAIDVARCKAPCKRVEEAPRRPYCTGAECKSKASYATHSGA